MQFFGYHGVLPEETKLGQRFLVDVELGLSLRAAGQTDNLEETVNYALVYEKAKHIVEGPPRRLIETLAESIAAAVLHEFTMVEEVRVRVMKPGAPIPGLFQQVSVEVLRTKSD